jgi:alkylation response protein AidB-like acyl-CoA dehydrogenase
MTQLRFEDQAQGAMFMTEQAAGSDISNTQTLARPAWRRWNCQRD